MDRRSGYTLLELLVCVAIVGILIALLLGGVQRARSAAARASAANSFRQVLLATHQFADAHDGQLPNIFGDSPSPGRGVFSAIAKYMERPEESLEPSPLLRFASDPSVGRRPGRLIDMPPLPGVPPGPVRAADEIGISIAANAVVFAVGNRMKMISDGTSTTQMFSEHYALCGPSLFNWYILNMLCGGDVPGQTIPCVGSDTHRATFADPGFDDVRPVTTWDGAAGQTTGSLPLTFQVRPALANCDPRTPQSTFDGGILTGFADGSVRFLKANISGPVYWGLVTPAGGEVVSAD